MPAALWPLTGASAGAKAPATVNVTEATRASVADQADHSRFREVFLPHLDDAFRLARWLSGSRADAEDIVQEASLRAMKGVGRFAGGNARAWVLTIVRNAAYTWMGRNRPASLVVADDPSVMERMVDEEARAAGRAPPTPEDMLIAKVDAAVLRRQVGALPAVFRDVIVLREINELSYGEIAEVMDVPVGTVMSRLARARRMLLAALGGETP